MIHRKDARVPVDCAATVRLHNKLIGTVRITNASPEGVYILTGSVHLPKGQAVELTVLLSGHRGTATSYRITGVVAHSSSQGAGLLFVDRDASLVMALANAGAAASRNASTPQVPATTEALTQTTRS